VVLLMVLGDIMGLKKFLKKTRQQFGGIVAEASSDIGKLAQEATAGITGSETLGDIVGGGFESASALSAFAMTGGAAGTEGITSGAGKVGGALGLGGEEEPTSALGGGGTSDIGKKKKDLEDNIRRNTTGLRQQSVLTAR